MQISVNFHRVCNQNIFLVWVQVLLYSIFQFKSIEYCQYFNLQIKNVPYSYNFTRIPYAQSFIRVEKLTTTFCKSQSNNGLGYQQINNKQEMKKLATVVGPSILSADFANLRAECQGVLDLGADSLHIDIMDGHFVNNLTIGPPVVASLRKSLPTAHLDCHLMVTHPEKYLDALAKAKIDCFTFHYEATYKDLKSLLKRIKELNIAAGVSIKPATPVPAELVELAKEGLVDKILVMTVEPGFGAQKFMAEVLPKVKELRRHLAAVDIQVDGGLNEETTKLAASHGANCIVAGSSIFGAQDRKEAIGRIKQAASSHLNELVA